MSAAEIVLKLSVLSAALPIVVCFSAADEPCISTETKALSAQVSIVA